MREEYLPELRSVFRELEITCETLKDNASRGAKLKGADLKKLREFEEFADHCDEVAIFSATDPEYIDEHFVLVHEPISFQFKRLYGAYTFNKLLRPMAISSCS